MEGENPDKQLDISREELENDIKASLGVFHRDAEERGLNEMAKGVDEFEKGIHTEENKLKELFVVLKTDVLDKFISPEEGHMREDYAMILLKQVHHVISIARAIHFPELIRSFEEEDKIVRDVAEIVRRYPTANVQTSPELMNALNRLRDMMQEQRDMIFSHERILFKEKRQLISILKEVDRLKHEFSEDHDKDVPASKDVF